MYRTDLFVAPDGGASADLGGLGVHFKVRGETTGGRFAIVEHPIEPGVLVDPHVHRHEDEMSFVLAGTIWARVGDQEIEAVPGSYVWKPRGVLHTFWNPGPEPARILEVISPAGFERLFEQVAELMEHPTGTTEDDVYELCRQYGLSFDRAWVPELERRFGPMHIV
jgi:quercetin dioxygenase-like cupin family protein